MDWKAVRWPIPLERPPAIRLAGRGAYGGGRRATWKLNFWCLHLYRYRADLWLDGKLFPIRPGHIGAIPPGVEMTYHFLEYGEQLCAHLELDGQGGGKESIPALYDAGKEFETFWRAFSELLDYRPAQPRRAEARLWDLLWALTDRPAAGAGAAGAGHGPVARACRAIEQRLASPFRVPKLAEEVGLSHNHLTRLFQAEKGTTVVGYIRARRMERARHLLRHSTQAIKSIAAEVGIPDLHLFNKTVRRELGAAPRDLRKPK